MAPPKFLDDVPQEEGLACARRPAKEDVLAPNRTIRRGALSAVRSPPAITGAAAAEDEDDDEEEDDGAARSFWAAISRSISADVAALSENAAAAAGVYEAENVPELAAADEDAEDEARTRRR